MQNSLSATAAVLVFAAVLASCTSVSSEPARPGSGSSVVRPGAPGEASRTVAASETVPGRAAYSAADVRFMQHMIVHHAQALVMTEMVAERTDREQIELLARRITDSQNSEIALMRAWLEQRDEPVADPHGQHGADRMPGMLTQAELDSLRAARAGEFDRLFIDFMVRHHEGALAMVEELFAGGGGEEPEVFQLASHVDADQRAEIERMRRLKAALFQRG